MKLPVTHTLQQQQGSCNAPHHKPELHGVHHSVKKLWRPTHQSVWGHTSGPNNTRRCCTHSLALRHRQVSHTTVATTKRVGFHPNDVKNNIRLEGKKEGAPPTQDRSANSFSSPMAMEDSTPYQVLVKAIRAAIDFFVAANGLRGGKGAQGVMDPREIAIAIAVAIAMIPQPRKRPQKRVKKLTGMSLGGRNFPNVESHAMISPSKITSSAAICVRFACSVQRYHAAFPWATGRTYIGHKYILHHLRLQHSLGIAGETHDLHSPAPHGFVLWRRRRSINPPLFLSYAAVGGGHHTYPQ